MVVLALFQGLARRRRLDPAAVPDDLLAQALRWLFGGLRAGRDADESLDRRGGAGDERMTDQEGDDATVKPRQRGAASPPRAGRGVDGLHQCQHEYPPAWP